jgi:hypothetical protein
MSPELKESILKLLDERSKINIEVVHDFTSLINNMLQLELKREIDLLRTMLTDNPETFGEQFKERCWEGGFEGEHYIAFLDMPQGLISQLYWDIAALTFKPKTMKGMLNIILSGSERGSESSVVLPENMSKEAKKEYLKPLNLSFDSVEHLDKLHLRLSPQLYDTLWAYITPSDPPAYFDALAAMLRRSRFNQQQDQALAKAIISHYSRFNGLEPILLWAVQTNNPIILKEVLASYPEEERVAVVKKELGFIQTHAGEYPESFRIILETMDEQDRLALLEKGTFYKIVKKHSETLLGIPETLIGILKLLSPTDRITALGLSSGIWHEINNKVLHEIAKDPILFEEVLELVPENQRMAIIDSLYQNKICVLHKTHYPEHLVALLPLGDRLQAVKLKDTEDRQTIVHLVADDPKRFKPLLDVLPKENLGTNHFLMSQDKKGFTALHQAAINPGSIKIALDLLAPKDRIRALQVTNQDFFCEDQSQFFSVLDKASFSPDHEHCIQVILESLPVEDRLTALQTKGFHGRSMMGVVLESPGLINVVKALLPEDQQGVFAAKKTDTPPQHLDSKLVKITRDMVETITTNIKTKQNTRLTSAQSGRKIDTLRIFGQWLEKNKNLDEADPLNELIVPFFKAVCKLKRHPINFFSDPHSVKESEKLIKEHWAVLKQHHNENLNFTQEELNKIDSVEQIELLFKEKLAQYKADTSDLGLG